MAVAILAEKPSVARDIARVLGAGKSERTCIRGNGYVVTWAIGHLVTLAEPQEIRSEWKVWRRERLPMLPGEWPLKILKGTQSQFNAVKKIINSREITELVCATDAGREGELIFRYIYEAARCRKPWKRLWISSLTPSAIRAGLDNLKDGSRYNGLADAARCRSRADWLVGMNLTRLYSLGHDGVRSVGRVQTPTLAILTERETAIRDFVPEPYFEVSAVFAPGDGSDKTDNSIPYTGTWFRNDPRTGGIPSSSVRKTNRRLPADGVEAGEIVKRVRAGNARIENLDTRTRRMASPLLYDLTELQRHANRLYGFTAGKTLTIAQAIYEKKKLITYPRTDSRYLSGDMAKTLPDIANTVSAQYRENFPDSCHWAEPGSRFVNDKKVTDHHAIIPTSVDPAGVSLTTDEQKIYDLVCRRFLSMWLDDHITRNTTVITVVTPRGTNPDPVKDRFESTGVSVEQVGWKILDIPLPSRKKKRGNEETILPPGLSHGQSQTVEKVKKERKETRPPPRFTDATLLTAMETAGKALDDRELSDAMRERGLGTPATRAAILETLVKRKYVQRKGKSIHVTALGMALIDTVHPTVKSPELTGNWEFRLKRMENGDETLPAFMTDIEKFIVEVVGAGDTPLPAQKAQASKVGVTVAVPEPEPIPEQTAPIPDETHLYFTESEPVYFSEEEPVFFSEEESDRVYDEWTAPSPESGPPAITDADPSLPAIQSVEKPSVEPSEIGNILRHRFRFTAFRPYQEAVCNAVTQGEDVLLVMPTGSGKSLCYQLPGIARGGTTLVISPLIALMEDQVLKLQEMGFRAQRIHSGRDRTASRQVCSDYLNGHLDFLFIAPERLAVPGFPEMLAKRKPVLIAIDEAHCISHWGHDFRPDYRLLGDRLPILRPAPIMGLTATATPRVQNDITELLDMVRPKSFIHGFRRTNIAIEVVEMAPSRRSETTVSLLGKDTMRPAIVYCSTRKNTEAVAEEINAHFPAAAYHAGLTPQKRDRVQTAFINSEIDVIVATIAFGMGIDKPDIRTVIHTALPSSLEGYYQEIGRAGRDGEMSKAILFYSYADRHIHLFLHEKNYPDESVMQSLYQTLKPVNQTRDKVWKKSRLTEEVFDNAIEKLWVHGGALVDPDDNIMQGDRRWITPYREQKNHGLTQLEEMTRFAGASTCRMQQFIRHFGDFEDTGGPCGICDICAPDTTSASSYRAPTETEVQAVEAIMSSLGDQNGQATGRLFKSISESLDLKRDDYEHVLRAMVRAGVIRMVEDSFMKNGQTIHYRRAVLTSQGMTSDRDELEKIRITQKLAGIRRKRKKVKKSPSRAAASRTGKSSAPPPTAWHEIHPGVAAALKQWRTGEARRCNLPAFRIFSNKALNAMATALPETEDELLAVHGIGPALLRRHGDDILEIIRTNR